MKFASDISKGIVICLSSRSFVVHVEGDPLDEAVSLKVNPLQTVRDLKEQIEQLKGFPCHQQELFFKQQALQNKQLVIDYRISSASRLTFQLQPSVSMSVYVEAFWGKTYAVELTPCSNCDDLK